MPSNINYTDEVSEKVYFVYLDNLRKEIFNFKTLNLFWDSLYMKLKIAEVDSDRPDSSLLNYAQKSLKPIQKLTSIIFIQYYTREYRSDQFL